MKLISIVVVVAVVFVTVAILNGEKGALTLLKFNLMRRTVRRTAICLCDSGQPKKTRVGLF